MGSFKDHPLWQLTATRFREFWREPGAVFWVFAFPILISVALGVAFRNQAPAMVPVAVLNVTPESSTLVAGLKKSPSLDVSLLSEEDATRGLQSGRVSAVVDPRGPVVLTDHGRPDALMVNAVVKDALERAAGRVDALTIEERKATSVGTRYIDFLLPGVLGFNLMGSSIWGVGWSLVQLRTRKLLKRLSATPMKRTHLLASFVLYRLALAVVEVAVLLAFGKLAFGVTVQGSLFGVAVASLLGVVAFSGISLLTASRAQNAETASGLMNLVTMPMSILSGVFFSADRFPEWMLPAIRLLPLTALNDSLRAFINEGAPLESQLVPFAVMLGWGAVGYLVALKVFRWQ
jgi:ABC-2 type transport system permease protein